MKRMEFYSGIDTKEKLVALTFDDGPNPVFTPLILDVLKNMNVTATFFLLGKRVEQFPNVARRIKKEGHCIANHTYDHGKDFRRAEKVIQEVIGVRCQFFKPPNNDTSNVPDDLPENVKVVNYCRNCKGNQPHINPNDWQWEHSNPTSNSREKAEAIFNQIKRDAEHGCIIQLHDGKQPDGDDHWIHRALPTYLALPIIIESLRAKGYRFVKLDDHGIELLKHECPSQ